MIKVLYITHQLAFSVSGGAEVQIKKTMENINRSYENIMRIDLFDPWNHCLDDYDIIHIFNPAIFSTESLLISQYAKNRNIKVVVSTIFYEYHVVTGNKFKHTLWELSLKLKSFISQIKFFEGLNDYHDLKETLLNADVLLPNTQEELDRLSNKFSIPKEKFIKIPNGVDQNFKFGKSEIFREQYKIQNFILSVGRIEVRKNTLKLIKAFIKSGLDTHLVIIGKVGDPDYYKLCMEAANDRVIFIPPVSNDSKLLQSAYKAAKVMVLPSYFETPGLAALEGGLAGLNIVITGVGGTKEYFEEYVWYVEPENEESIVKALISAYNSPKTDKLSQHIEKNFTWGHVVDLMKDVYLNL